MAETDTKNSSQDIEKLRSEVARLNKIVQVLMNRIERSTTTTASSEFDAFRTTITLEEQVRRRTAELETALRDNQRITRALRESEAKFRSVLNQPLVGITMVHDGRVVFSNAKFAEMFGYAQGDVAGLELADVAMEKDRGELSTRLCQQVNGENPLIGYTFVGRRKDSTPIDVELHGSLMELGEQRFLVCILLDVSERVRTERESQALYDLLKEQSVRDSLTGLFNRRYLDVALEQEIGRASRDRRVLSAILCDIDHFKSVNDKYGHLAGDEVLRTFASEISKHCRESDLACRYGGEEFLVILPGTSQIKACERAERMRAAIAAAATTYAGTTIAITASFGVASFPDDGGSSVELLSKADKALYSAKKHGRNRVVAAAPST